jgi:hypothetical protein
MMGKAPVPRRGISKPDPGQNWLIMAVTLAVSLVQLDYAVAIRDVSGFGAIPDDGIDDAVAIQNAIDASTVGDTVMHANAPAYTASL